MLLFIVKMIEKIILIYRSISFMVLSNISLVIFWKGIFGRSLTLIFGTIFVLSTCSSKILT